ncbi:MAG: hypothetical protein LBS52_10035 [Dysgonamonadaceae bacterium]|jgi:hypothetical protein|nr:hypothetical protein [Dysgonamonadaceae bacterium]
MDKISFILLLLAFGMNIVAQETYPTESEKDLYWQPERQIQFSDYQSTIDINCIKYNEKYGVQMSSNIGFRKIVDVPKKRGKIDKGYIVPVFCKNCSCILSEDSLGLLVDRLLFDITETCARSARKDLSDFQITGNIDNPNAMFFTSITNKWDEFRKGVFATIIKEVLVDKIDTAYISWRKIVDEKLEQTKEYATTPKDCYRFVAGKPVEKGYKQAKTIVGDMRRNKETEKTN